jgi:pimeloyl-ACP methyl ester carboxylesterase
MAIMFIDGKRCAFAITTAWVLCGCSAPDRESIEPVGTAESALTPDELSFPVSVRGTGRATIAAHVFENPTHRGAVNVLAVHGLAETGFVFEPLAQAIFADRSLGLIVRRVVAIDLPGHGDSSDPTTLPAGATFGDLTIEDEVSVVLQSIDALRQLRVPASAIVAHSMGGLEVQVAQQQLLDRGSSLAAHGIFGAVLLAPVPVANVPWVPPSADLSPFVVADPVLGAYVLLPPAAFIPLAFTTTAGTVASDAPTPAQVQAGRYVGAEPLTGVLELIGASVPAPDGGTTTLQRPSASAGSLGSQHGTLTSVVSFSEDTLVPAQYLRPLYEYLTGDKDDVLYRAVVAPDAVHEMLISNPTVLLDAIRPIF